MGGTGLWTRVFIGLLIAVLVPTLFVVGALILAESILADADAALIAIVVVVGVIAWAAIVAIVYTRVLAEEAIGTPVELSFFRAGQRLVRTVTPLERK